MNDTLTAEFHEEMLDVHHSVKAEVGHNATQFLAMVHQLGGLSAAKKLLLAPRVQSGFKALALKGRLDISMEARIMKPKYA